MLGPAFKVSCAVSRPTRVAAVAHRYTLGNRVKIETAVLGSPSVIVLLVSVDVKQN